MLLLYGTTSKVLSPELEDMLTEFSKGTFGLGLEELNFNWPENFRELPKDSLEKWKIKDAYDEHEDQFETSVLSPDDAVPVLIKLGVDFTDLFGCTMRCTKYLMRQAEAAAKGIAGNLPDLDDVEAARWGDQLIGSSNRYNSPSLR